MKQLGHTALESFFVPYFRGGYGLGTSASSIWRTELQIACWGISVTKRVDVSGDDFEILNLHDFFSARGPPLDVAP